MKIGYNKLSEMLSEAFDFGYSGTAEARDESIAEILAKHNIVDTGDDDTTKEEASRIYTIAELQQMPVNAEFLHSTLLKCKIQQRDGERYMMFESAGLQPACFNVDGYPWNGEMKRLS